MLYYEERWPFPVWFKGVLEEIKPDCMNELILHAGLDKVGMTVVGQAHTERQMERNSEQIQGWVTLEGERWGAERGEHK